MKTKTFCFFITSTFNDMQGERDYIRKFTIPRLRECFQDYPIELQVVDLRWGVNTLDMKEDEQESKVLHVCIDAVHDSKPFFIGLIGKRYGWIPPVERTQRIMQNLDQVDLALIGDQSVSKSITEMEILLGALRDSETLSHSFFCYRDDKSYGTMPEEKRKQVIDKESESKVTRENAYKLDALVEKINNATQEANLNDHIIPYTATWNEKTDSFNPHESFGEELFNRLYHSIRQEIETDKEICSYSDSEQDILKEFIDSHVFDFCGFEEYLDEQEKFLVNCTKLDSAIKGRIGRIITGFSGCGKSSIFSKLYERLDKCKEKNSFFVLAHAAGISQKSIYVLEMISNWNEQMKRFLGDEGDNNEYEVIQYKKLISRLQARGVLPVVLIDSLDSFYRDSLLGKFDFLPVGVPFICTALKGECDDLIHSILKKNPNVTCEEMRYLSHADSMAIVNHVSLKRNYKEIPAGLVNRLLSKTKSDGKPSFTSPLWLRLALTILMELGSIDFMEIYHLPIKKDDAKIAAYLEKVIDEMPADAENLFRYFIDMTCRYFEENITVESLIYIAISQYGIHENYIRELIGDDDWNELDFTSLRYWLRDFIRRDRISGRWLFTHNILRNVVCEMNQGIIAQREQKFINFLLEKGRHPQDYQEVIYKLIMRNKFDLLEEHVSDLKHYFYDPFLQLVKVDESGTMDFMKRFIKIYPDSQLVEAAKTVLYNEGMTISMEPYISLMNQITDFQVSQYSIEKLMNDISLVKGYFEALSTRSEYLTYQGDMKYIEFFQEVQQVFERLHEHYGDDVFVYGLRFNYFVYWAQAINSLKRIADDECGQKLYENNLFGYVESLVTWCLKNKSVSDYALLIERVMRRNGLNRLQEIDVMRFVQDGILTFIKRYNGYEYLRDDMIDQADKLIKFYMGLFSTIDEVIETPLMKALGYDISEDFVGNPQDNDADDFENQRNDDGIEGVLMQMDPSMMEDHDEDWQEVDLEKLKAPKALVDVDQIVLDDGTIPTREEVAAAERELDVFLKEHYQDRKRDEAIMRENIRLQQRVFVLNYKAGNREKANPLLTAYGQLVVELIADMNDNYEIGDDASHLINYLNTISKVRSSQEQLSQAEVVVESLLHSFYHHYDDRLYSQFFDYLIAMYEANQDSHKTIALLEKVIDIITRAYCERSFMTVENRYRDLSYVRPCFQNLFLALTRANRIKEAVILLEQWHKICSIAYIDNLDTGYAYEDFLSIYDNLAMLYDGTPAILEGMKERMSVFLKDKYIQVHSDNKWGYINHDGEVVTPIVFENAWKAEKDTLLVCLNGKWVYMNPNNKNWGSFYDDACPICNQWGVAREGTTWELFSQSGYSADIKVDCVSFHGITANGMVKVLLKSGNEYRFDYLMNDGATLLFNGRMDQVSTPNKGAIVASYHVGDQQYVGLFDMNGKELTQSMRYESIAPFGDQLLTPAFVVGKKSCFIDRQGREFVTDRFREVRPFSSGRAAVAIGEDRYWGFIDQKGDVVIKPQYADVGDFHEDLAWFCEIDRSSRHGFGYKSSRFGFIDVNGNVVIEAIFEDVSSFYNGRALVWQDGVSKYISNPLDVPVEETFHDRLLTFKDHLLSFIDDLISWYQDIVWRCKKWYIRKRWLQS